MIDGKYIVLRTNHYWFLDLVKLLHETYYGEVLLACDSNTITINETKGF